MSNINNVKIFFTNATLDLCNTNFCKSIGKHVSWLQAGLGKMDIDMLALSLSLFLQLAILGFENKKKIKAVFSTCKWKIAQVSIDKLQGAIKKKFENNYKDVGLKCDWLFKLLFSNEKKVDEIDTGIENLKENSPLMEITYKDMFIQILTFLDPSDLKVMEQVSHTSGQLDQLESGWKSVANRIGCPLNTERSSKEQVKAFINLLIKKIKDREDLKCQELHNLVKCETVDGINILQKLLKVRDTQIVWKTLANQMNQRDSFPEFKSTDSYKNLLKIPKNFQKWCNNHANQLAVFNEPLILASQKLTSLPSEIGNLTQLWLLHLNDNQITSLPPEIGNLTHLSSLYLNNNQLTLLPSEIGNLTHLHYLFLNNNQLTSLPPEIGNLDLLSSLHLNNNHLTSLPPEIGNLTHLHFLFLNNNQLTSLPPEIGKAINLIHIELKRNKFNPLPTKPKELINLKSFILHEDEGKFMKLVIEFMDGVFISITPTVKKIGLVSINVFLLYLNLKKRS